VKNDVANGALNGNSLESLAGMTGVKVREEKRVQFPIASLDDALAAIRRLKGTGSLTVSFTDGGMQNVAEWKTSKKTT
jgi:hypothetical protein